MSFRIQKPNDIFDIERDPVLEQGQVVWVPFMDSPSRIARNLVNKQSNFIAQANLDWNTLGGRPGLYPTLGASNKYLRAERHLPEIGGDGGKLSVSFWVRFTASGAYQCVVCKPFVEGAHSPQYFRWAVFVTNSNDVRWYLGDAGSLSNVSLRSGITTNAWEHWCFTWDNSGGTNNVKYYVNGAYSNQGTLTKTVPADTERIYIGANGAGGEYVNGAMDDVRIWNRIITPAEVRKIYREPWGNVDDDVFTGIAGSPPPDRRPYPTQRRRNYPALLHH